MFRKLMIQCGIMVFKMWELGVRGKMWRVMYSVSRSAVLLDGECSEAFHV